MSAVTFRAFNALPVTIRTVPRMTSCVNDSKGRHRPPLRHKSFPCDIVTAALVSVFQQTARFLLASIVP